MVHGEMLMLVEERKVEVKKMLGSHVLPTMVEVCLMVGRRKSEMRNDG
jgi:hypothetical protein